MAKWVTADLKQPTKEDWDKIAQTFWLGDVPAIKSIANQPIQLDYKIRN